MRHVHCYRVTLDNLNPIAILYRFERIPVINQTRLYQRIYDFFLAYAEAATNSDILMEEGFEVYVKV